MRARIENRWSALLLFVIAVVVVVETTGLTAKYRNPKAALGPAPLFSLRTPSGELVRLRDQRDKVVLLTFWTTWCPNCEAKMPVIESLQQRFGSRGFDVYAINMGESDETIAKYLAKRPTPLTILADPGNVAAKYNVDSIPAMFLIDGSGQLIYSSFGAGSNDELKKQVEQAVRM